jgi:diaminopimelate epimerase
MQINFIKMQGAGNDYIYLDLVNDGLDVDFHDLAKNISSRHFGVGGDGLVLIMRSSSADYRMRMFNADGSEAEMCGNAIRCVGKHLFDNGYLISDEFSIETLGGIKKLWITKKDQNRKAITLRVDMGEPILNGREIPVDIDKNPVIDLQVMGYTGTAIGMGNPHFVIPVESITDNQVLVDGPKLETNSIFPNRANIEFIRVIDRQTLEMRVWERGSGETLACGTGACACAVAGVLNNLVDRSVDVKLLGGPLTIEWNENNRVYMSGPAHEVFRGSYDYDYGL